jgi:hypothetical protein
MVQRFKFLWILILLCTGCIKEFDLDFDAETGTLVVDGYISDEQAVYTVNLSRTGSFDNLNTEPVRGAEVRISSSNQENALMQETEPGRYELDFEELKGQTGVSYSLHIKTTGGEEYHSTPELLNPASPIDTVYFEYFTSVESIGDFSSVRTGNYQVYVDVQDDPATQNFYRYRTNRIYEVFTDLPPVMGPPPPCCYTCYLSFSTQDAVFLSSDEFVNGNIINRIPLNIIPNNSSGRVLIEVTQLSLSQQAFRFWRQIQQQQESVGSIFDPPPALIRGNIYKVGDPDEVVLGYFSASSVRRDNVMIVRGNYPEEGRDSERKTGDCRTEYPGATSNRPPEFDL